MCRLSKGSTAGVRRHQSQKLGLEATSYPLDGTPSKLAAGVLVEGDWRPGTPARMLKSGQEVVVKLYSYVVEHDTGYAPNPYLGFCADSEGCRSAFRTDVDHDSEVMPISVPN